MVSRWGTQGKVTDLHPPQTKHQSYEVHTPDQLSNLLNDADFQKADRIRLIEVYMPRGDAPAGLVSQAKLTADANAKV